MTIRYPSRLSLACTPTPLQALDRISKHLGGPRIWIKRDDLTGMLLSGNKIRKLEFVIAQALEEGADTLITCGGLQSNHCRATAFVGAQLGLKVHLILRGTEPQQMDGNYLLDALAGANISTYPATEYSKKLNVLFSKWQQYYRDKDNKPFIIPTGASDEIGVWGYVAACGELDSDFNKNNISPNFIFVASGSGGTQAGLTVGCHLYDLDCQVVGMAVCDDEDYFIQKVSADLTQWNKRYDMAVDLDALSIDVNANYIGPGYGKATPEVFETIKLLAQLEGVVLDPVYTGKAFHGLVSEIIAGNLSSESDVVFVHTGGLFGLFSQKEELNFVR